MNTTIRRAGDIIPAKAAPLKTLTMVMTVMSYLSILAIGALLLTNKAVDNWAKGLSSEATVQIVPKSAFDMEAEVEKAATALSVMPGIARVEVLPREAGEKLLEPWLGSDNLSALPVPRLIRVVLDPLSPPDIDRVGDELKAAVPQARLDTHRRWEEELKRMGGTMTLIASLVLGLIAVSAVALIIFAARAVLAANKPTVEILHLSGADNSFIARALDRRFLVAGLAAGSLGFLLGLGTFYGIGVFGGEAHDGLAMAARSLLHAPPLELRWSLVAFAAVPLAATFLALLTSRLALLRMLAKGA